jgi:hypothetical protein
MRAYLLTLVIITAACSTPPEEIMTDVADTSFLDVHEIRGSEEIRFAETVPFEEVTKVVEVHVEDLTDEVDAGPVCAPGDGCFLDPCSENGQCQAGWCVEHLGDGVCTQACQEECPPGWSCQAVGGGPDVVFICVSNFANLCKPCATTEGCKAVGADDVCVNYGPEGNFCGGGCDESSDCPWGFSCLDTTTYDGVETRQCVADAGVCPCALKSVQLSLSTPCVEINDLGECAGKRVCTDGGLSECDALEPAPEICDGIDNNCNSLVDEETCDDDNGCTEDQCSGEDGCVNTALSGIECLDGDPCTVADHCEEGLCIGAPVACDDQNPCTDDMCTATGGCEYLPIPGSCDDDNPCTVGDQCGDGQCSGTPVSCDCQTDDDCAVLEDEDVCNGTLLCNLTELPYKCEVDPATVISCPEPEGINAPCLMAVCNSMNGECTFESGNDSKSCDDEDACTFGERCLDGACDEGSVLNCNDGNPCTDESCNGETGCVITFNVEPCSDGNVCTVSDLCADGECASGSVLECDDDNICNGQESCDESVGCLVGEPLVCDDGNQCNGIETCDPLNGCQLGVGGSCDDGNPCTVDSCALDGCVNTPDNNLPCDDNNACTTGDHCDAGSCVFDDKMVCTDDSPCTDNTCDSAAGCITTLNTAPCDDDDVCTTGDHCHLGECISSGTLTCNDGNSCTDDLCLAGTGCQFSYNTTGCNDDNECTSGDQCKNGWCQGVVKVCNDGNLCTDDVCKPDTGCVFTNNFASCEDGDPCSVNDACENGQCVAGSAADCDDGNPCTDDSCTGMGCVFISNEADCDDLNACTSGDYCLDTVCIPGGTIVCDDENVCTDDSCQPESGCQFDANILPCNDGNLCTQDDRCEDTVCLGGDELLCDDAQPCTSDSCEPLLGCVYIAANCCGNNNLDPGEDCDDGNQDPNDGCNEQCQYESFTYNLSFSPDDFDVAYDGRLVAVGREGSNVVARCFRSDRVAVGPKFTAFAAPAGAVVENVHLGVAGISGYWGIFVRHQTIPGDYGSRRGAFRMFNNLCAPVTDGFLVGPDEVFDEGRAVDFDEQGNAYLTWIGKDKKLFLAIIGPDGNYKLEATNFDTCKYNFSVQLAVQANGSRGVITCQGHDGNPIWFWLFDSNGDITKSEVQVAGAPPSSWYFSHEVGMNAAGQFVVLWAANGEQSFKAALYDENGDLVSSINVGATVAGSCYDPFRNDNTKIQSPGGEFILPYVLPADGPCYSAHLHGFHRVTPGGQSILSSSSQYFMQTLVVDNFNSTYVRDGKSIRLNSVNVNP